MESDAILGVGILILCVFLLCGLVVWSIRTINRITRRSLTTVRTIVKDLRNE